MQETLFANWTRESLLPNSMFGYMVVSDLKIVYNFSTSCSLAPKRGCSNCDLASTALQQVEIATHIYTCAGHGSQMRYCLPPAGLSLRDTHFINWQRNMKLQTTHIPKAYVYNHTQLLYYHTMLLSDYIST